MSNFPTMGTSAATSTENLSGAPSANTIPVPRKNSQAGPVEGSGGHRQGVLERNGFKGAPQVNTVYPNSPEAANVFRNVRLVPSAKGNRDFYARRAEGSALVDAPFPGGSWTPPTKP